MLQPMFESGRVSGAGGSGLAVAHVCSAAVRWRPVPVPGAVANVFADESTGLEVGSPPFTLYSAAFAWAVVLFEQSVNLPALFRRI